MNTIQNWIGMEFNWLVIFAIGSTAILIVAYFLSWLLRNRSAACRFNVWQSAFLALLFVPLGLILLPGIPLGLGVQNRAIVNDAQVSHVLQPPADFHVNQEITEHASHFEETRVNSRPPIERARASKQNTVTARDSEFRSENNLQNESSESVAAIGLAQRIPWKTFLFSIWLAGVVWMLGRILRSCWLISQMKRRADRLHQIDSMHPVVKLSNSLIGRDFQSPPVPIYISSDISIPITLGVFKPCVLIPESFSEWPVERLRMVLKHELAHVSRRDVLWQLSTAISKSVFWFQPLAWLGERRMKLERERACDDHVLNRDENACDYASVLLGFAAELSFEEIEFAGALSMAQKPIEQRLKTILEPLTPRGGSNGSFRWGIGLMFATLLVSVCMIRPFGQPVVARELPSELPSPVFAPPLNRPTKNTTAKQDFLPKKLTGKVVDHQGKPVSGARVEFAINASQRNSTVRLESVTLLPATTNDAGEYSLDTNGIEVPHKSYLIQGMVYADEFPSIRYGYRISELTDTVMPVAKLKEARKITGKVIAPLGDNGSNEPPIKPQVRAGNNDSGDFWRKTISCNADGSFEIYAPKVGYTDLVFEAENYAPVRVALAQSESATELGDIALTVGTEVFGKVINSAGAPVPGVTINMLKMERLDPSTWSDRHTTLSIESTFVTNEQGQFRLPLHTGKCMISIDRSRKVVGGGVAPIVLPAEVDLSKPIKTIEVNFVEGETFTVRGSVRWADGAPQSNVEVTGTAKLGNAYGRLESAETDEFGNYELRFPKGSEQISVYVRGALGPDGEWSSGFAKDDPRDINPQATDNLRFDKCAADINEVNWVLKKRAVREQRTVRAFTEADYAFDEIGKRYEQSWKTAWQQAKSSETGETKTGSRIQRENEEKFVDDLMKFEEQYRGEFAGVMALNWVVSWGRQDDHPNATAAAKIAWQLLLKHYVEHSDIDMMIGSSYTQLEDPVFNQFIEAIQRSNPHDHVQAALLFKQSERLRDVVVHHSMLARKNWPQMPNQKWVDFVKKTDPAKATAEIRSKIAELTDKYSDVHLSGFSLGPTMNLRFNRSYSYEKRGKTFAEDAKRILFQVERLIPGQPVPEIVGEDVFGKPFKLSDLAGKVVLVCSSGDWGYETKDTYAAFRQLKNKYKDQPFEIVTVMTDRKLETSKAAVESGRITWQTVWDSHQGPIAYQWNARSHPSTFYLIDHKGIITALTSYRDDYEVLVEELVVEAKKSVD